MTFNSIKDFLLQKLHKSRFEKQAVKVLGTPPLNYRLDDRLTIVSMVGSDSVNMYLLAIKSFMMNLGYGTIEVIDDGSLTEKDFDTLKRHIPDLRVSNAAKVETHGCPSYISWKRLFRIQQLAETSYVIQLDSDTLTLSPLVDIDNHVRSNRGFLVGNQRWNQGVDVRLLGHVVSQWSKTHVQPSAEENFYKLEYFSDGTKYLRGCAGFAGYPKGFATIGDIQSLSGQIEEQIGKKWHEWGSEQTATCCLISKCEDSEILPWPAYQNYKFPMSNEHTASMNFVHFIGTTRFSDDCYSKLAATTLTQLSVSDSQDKRTCD